MPESPEQLNVKKPPEDMEKKPDDLEVEHENEPEKLEDLEKLAQEKIESAKKESEGLSGSEKKIDDCNNSVNLPADKLEEIKATSGVVEKLGAVNEKERSLLEEMKAKMKTAVAIGMAAMTFAGAGGIKEAEVGVKLKTITENASIENSQQEVIKTKREKELLEYIEKLKKDIEDTERKIAMERDPKSNVEKVRNNLKKHVGSKEYLDKLKVEFKGDIEKAKNIQKERLSYLNDAKIDFTEVKNMNGKYAMPEWIPDKINKAIPQWLIKIIYSDKIGSGDIAGFYQTLKHEVVLPDIKDNNLAQHEFLHASTKSDAGISEKTKKILEDSYDKLGNSKDKYYSRFTERLVRKQQLDLEMQKLNIKKYGELFTKKHYDKLMEYYKGNKLSSDAREFIETTKPEYFEKIFNEIAKNEEENKNPSSLV